jgi:CRISPR-associated protein Csb2
VKLTERFRDRVIRERCCQLTGRPDARYGDLNAAQRDDLRLIRGLDGEGRRVEGDATTFFALIPDDQRLPTRLLCWRTSPFTDDEIDAFLAAGEHPFRWEYGSDDWQVRVVPLPVSVARPAEYWEPGRVWESVTPFVLPAGRRRTRGNGRPRTGETTEVCLRKLVVRFGFPEPEVQLISPEPVWVTIHETPDEPGQRARERGTRMRPGYRLRLTFPEPVAGPLCVGHSCHFGLGLFERVE